MNNALCWTMLHLDFLFIVSPCKKSDDHWELPWLNWDSLFINFLPAVFGTGKVVALGDSSPTDDGTGAPGDVLYNGWSAYSHSKLLLNASLWLAE